MLDLRAPAASAILAKASGQKLHAGGAPWPVGGPAYSRVIAWIQAGARLDGGGRGLGAPVASAPAAAPAPALSAPKSAAKPAAPPTAPAEIVAAPAAPPAIPDEAPPEAPPPPANDFAGAVHPLLVRTCAACHGPVGTAAATRLVLSSDVAADYAKVRPLVDPATPAASLLLTKAAGEMHAGGALLKAGGAEQALLLGWVAAGAARAARRRARPRR